MSEMCHNSSNDIRRSMARCYKEVQRLQESHQLIWCSHGGESVNWVNSYQSAWCYNPGDSHLQATNYPLVCHWPGWEHVLQCVQYRSYSTISVYSVMTEVFTSLLTLFDVRGFPTCCFFWFLLLVLSSFIMSPAHHTHTHKSNSNVSNFWDSFIHDISLIFSDESQHLTK
jgi:hypothetical protein